MAKRNSRDLGLKGTGAGKGDAERSPGWRKQYDDINWGRPAGEPVKRFRKVYGTPAPKVVKGPHIRVS